MALNTDNSMLSTKKMREIEFKVLEIFERFGFEEVHVPLLDFSSDRRAVHIREDFTYEIAKAFVDRKVYYRGSILRTTSSGKPREIYQIGCEIVRCRDVLEEDVVLCADVLNSVLVEMEKTLSHQITVMIGHYGLVSSVLGENAEAFFRKNTTRISELIKAGEVDADTARIFFRVLSDLDEVRKVIDKLPTDLEIFSSKISVRKVYNLSERVEKDYYNGLIFYGFFGRTRFLSGGRYRIDSKEGIGFSLNLLSFEIMV